MVIFTHLCLFFLAKVLINDLMWINCATDKKKIVLLWLNLIFKWWGIKQVRELKFLDQNV